MAAAHAAWRSPTGEPLAVGPSASRELVEETSLLLLEEREGGRHASPRGRGGRACRCCSCSTRRPRPTGRARAAARGAAPSSTSASSGSARSATLPGECRTIEHDEDVAAAARHRARRTGETVENVTVDGVAAASRPRGSPSRSRRCADTRQRPPAAAVPRRSRSLELLGAEEATPALIERRWADRRRAPAVPLGVGDEGRSRSTCARDGPHALVGGTTGAGKTELLQTLVASLALDAPAGPADLPARRLQGRRRVQGVRRAAAHRRLRHRPRRAPRRSARCISLNAELKRRERRAARRGRQGPDRHGARDPAGAPPSLGDRDRRVRDARARRCRSSSRASSTSRSAAAASACTSCSRPSGRAASVTENIRANMNLRIALRVAGRARART